MIHVLLTNNKLLSFQAQLRMRRILIPCWTYAGSAVQWCESVFGPDPPSGPAFCSGEVYVGLPCLVVLLAGKGITTQKIYRVLLKMLWSGVFLHTLGAPRATIAVN